jgi:hypothetical protein
MTPAASVGPRATDEEAPICSVAYYGLGGPSRLPVFTFSHVRSQGQIASSFEAAYWSRWQNFSNRA